MTVDSIAFIATATLVIGALLSGQVSKWKNSKAQKKAAEKVRQAKVEAVNAEIIAKEAEVKAVIASDLTQIASEHSAEKARAQVEYEEAMSKIESAKLSNDMGMLLDISKELAMKALTFGAKEKK